MKQVNKVMISGNLAKKAAIRKTKSGVPVASFTVVVSNLHRDRRTGKVLSDPNFVECTMFGDEAELWEPRLVKGAEVTVAGSLRSSKWERDGDMKFSTDVLVDAISVAERPARRRPAQAEAKAGGKPEVAAPKPEAEAEAAPEAAERLTEPDPEPLEPPAAAEPAPEQAEPEAEAAEAEDEWEPDFDLDFDLDFDGFEEE